MISDVYQTSMSASALSDAEQNDEGIAGSIVFVPPHANFSAQACLNFFTGGPLNPHPNSVDGPLFNGNAQIIRYATYGAGGTIDVTWGPWDTVSVQNGYFVEFEVTASAIWGVAVANATGTVFIQS